MHHILLGRTVVNSVGLGDNFRRRWACKYYSVWNGLWHVVDGGMLGIPWGNGHLERSMHHWTLSSLDNYNLLQIYYADFSYATLILENMQR